MALSKEARAALKDSDFAIPLKRFLPLVDRELVLMASNAINEIKGITAEERILGRLRIVNAAATFGINVPLAKKMHLHFESMALEMPTVKDHPNRHPFSGIMTRLNIASDFPVGGTTKKKVVIPTSVALEAIPTLLGMAIDYTPKFDGHDRRSKIGIITEAFVGEEDLTFGTPLHIAGFFYAADFPKEVEAIQLMRERLGFSYEAEACVDDMDSDPWVCTSCEFTGAAVLQKDKAAFTRTSINASQGEIMNEEEIKALQAKAEKADALEKEITDLKAAAAEKAKMEAASVQHLVKPHADAMRECAAKMNAAGIGADSASGHAAILNKMADHMEAEAVMGRIPASFSRYDLSGAAQKDAVELKASIDAAVKEATKGFEDQIASLTTKSSDAEKKVAALSASKTTETGDDKSGRKSLHAGSVALLKKIGLNAEAEGFKVADLDTACRKAGLTSQDSLSLKLNLKAAGILTV